MRKKILSMLMVALWLGTLGVWPAQAASPSDVKPLAVVSFAGYDELIGDVEMVGKLAGMPDIAKRAESLLKLATKDKGLAGLDKKRPWGAVIQADGSKLRGYGFVPVTDLKQLLDVLKPYLRDVKEHDDGVYEIPARRQSLFVRQKGGWAVVCDNRDALAEAPADPGGMLEGLGRQYDLAIRLNVCNVPAEHREKFIARLKQQAARHLKQRPREDDQEFAIRKIVTREILQSVVRAVNELEQVTFGWSLDHHAEKALLEVSATALKDTSAAETFAKLAQAKTAFGGFKLPGAAVTGSVACQYDHVNQEQLAALFRAIRAEAFKAIEAEQKSPEKAKVAKRAVRGLLEVAQETVASGRVDGAMAVVLRSDAATLVAGRYVADGAKLEKTLKRLVRAARKEHPDFVAKVLKTNADRYKGVRFHVLSLPIPEKDRHRRKAVQLVGEKLEVVVGIGAESVYLGAGKDALKTLKQAIEESETKRSQTALPVELSVALSEIARFTAAIGKDRDKRRAEKALAALEQAPGKDHVTLVAVPIDRGVKLRLEFEEGVLKMLGSMRQRK